MKKNFVFILFSTFFLVLIFINKDVVALASFNAINLFETKIFPSLFIMFILQDLIINYNGAYYFSKITNNLFSKIFKLSKNGQMAFILSLFSGSPSNAFILNEQTQKKQISTKEANHILKFSCFANPLFLYTMLSLFLEHNRVLKIILALYLSNFILAFLLRKDLFSSNEQTINKEVNFGKILTNSIKKSTTTLIMILGTISFFMIVSSIISNYITNTFFNTTITGLLEITAGLNLLIDLEATSFLKEILAIIFISFGGLSIHTQVFSIISNNNLSYKSFFLGRLYATVIAILIIIII